MKVPERGKASDKLAIGEFLKREGQFLLPMVEFVERAEMAIDEVIDVMGRATIEAVLDMSAEALAGPKQACKARTGGEAAWYGRQGGQVVPRGAEGARGAAAAADERPGRGRRARGAGLPGDATAGAIGGPDAGDPAGRREHAALRRRHSGDGRHGGREQVGGELGRDRGE